MSVSYIIYLNAPHRESGPGRFEEGKRIALEVKKGDKVLIGKYSGTEVKIEGDEYLIMREDDILAIVA